MGVYKAAVVTEGGQNLIAQALADSKVLMFISAKTSSYAYPSGTNITALTGLQDVVQSVIPSKSQVLHNNVAQVTARFDNDGITQQYPIHTIGLYAQVDEGPEILFSVTQAITPDEMPVQSDVSPSAFIYNIQHTVQNAAQITITVNPAGTATVEDILAIENPEFDDSGSVTGIASFPDFLSKVVSKMNIFQFYRDFKAGLQFILHTGQLVNNCTSTAADLPLAAAQGKVLMDMVTKLNSDITKRGRHLWEGSCSDGSITVSDLNKYIMFAVGSRSIPVILIGWQIYGLFHAYGIDLNAYTWGHRLYCMQAGISGDTLSNIKTAYVTVTYGSTNSEKDTFVFTDIWGIF